MGWLTGLIWQFHNRSIDRLCSPEDGLHIDTERMRHRRELARYQGQVGDNLTVQTTIDMARTQTWMGGG